MFGLPAERKSKHAYPIESQGDLSFPRHQGMGIHCLLAIPCWYLPQMQEACLANMDRIMVFWPVVCACRYTLYFNVCDVCMPGHGAPYWPGGLPFCTHSRARIVCPVAVDQLCPEVSPLTTYPCWFHMMSSDHCQNAFVNMLTLAQSSLRNSAALWLIHSSYWYLFRKRRVCSWQCYLLFAISVSVVMPMLCVPN